MRGLSGGLVGVMALGMAWPVWAASVDLPRGMTSENEKAIDTGIEYTRIFERRFKPPVQETNKLILSNQSHLRLGYTFVNWLQPFAKLGTSEFEQKRKNSLLIGSSDRRTIDFKYEWAFSWGGGIAGTYPVEEGWFVGYSTQYLRSDNALRQAVDNGEASSHAGGKGKVREWDASGLVGYSFDVGNRWDKPPKIYSYLGGRYSDFELHTESMEYDLSSGNTAVPNGVSRANDKFGVFGGVALDIGDVWQVALEGRLVDEKAVTGRFSVRF